MMLIGSMLPWSGGRDEEPRLAVSFKHPGALTEVATGPTPEEIAKLPVHMRPQRATERRRVSVFLSDEGGEGWNLQADQDMEFQPCTRCVVLFDRTSGFSFHEPPDA